MPQTRPTDDAALVPALLRGEATAADLLIDRFATPLVRYFRVHLPDPGLAEDMAQEVFVRLLGTLRRGKAGPVRSLYSLVFTIARNLAIDATKMHSRRPRTESLTLPGDEETGPGPVMVDLKSTAPDPREHAVRAQRDRRVEEALRQLPRELREVVVLRHVEGLGGREISAILGVAEGTVWSRLGRGLAELRILLGDPGTEPKLPRNPGEAR